MNSFLITKCNECSDSRPNDSFGCGIFCDELMQIVSEDDCEALIPDNCPRLSPNKKIQLDTKKQCKCCSLLASLKYNFCANCGADLRAADLGVIKRMNP